jgi:WD40 repeat protein
MLKINRLAMMVLVLGLLSACGIGDQPPAASLAPTASPARSVAATASPAAGVAPAQEWQRVASWRGGQLQFRMPAGVAVNSQGLIYVADTGNQRIQVLRSDSVFVSSWGSVGTGPGQFAGKYNGPRGIAIDARDNVYVVDSAGGRVQKFTSAGEFIAAWGEPGTADGQFRAGEHNGPTGIAIDSAGNVYVADTANSRIQKFTAEGAFVAQWKVLFAGDESASPTWLAIGGDRLYVTDGIKERVHVSSLDGAPIGTWSGASFERVGGIAVGASGEVFVADEGRVQIFTPDGELLSAISDQDGISGPASIGFDRDGRLYVVAGDSFEVVMYAPAGAPLASVPTAGPLPTPPPSADRPAIGRSPRALTPGNVADIAALTRLGGGTIGDAAISADGQIIAVASSTGVSLYDGATLEPQRSLPTPGQALAVAFAPDGRRLAIGLDSGAVLIADMGAGGALLPLDAPNRFPFHVALAFSPDGATLASATSETVKLWRVADGALIHTLAGHRDTVAALGFSADGATLLSVDAGLDGVEESHPIAVRLWVVQTGAMISSLDTNFFFAGRIAIAPGADRFLTVSQGDGAMLWEVQSGALAQGPRLAPDAVDGAFLADGSGLALIRRSGAIELYDSAGGLTRALGGTDQESSSLAVSADGGRIVAVGADQTVRLWSGAGAEVAHEVGGFSMPITDAALSPDGSALVAGTADGQLMLWDLTTQTLLWSVKAHSWEVSRVAFSPDGKTVASGGEFMVEISDFPGEALRLWNVADGAPLRSLTGHTHSVEALAFSPNGRMLASASFDGTVAIWQVADGTMLKKLSEDEVYGSLAFTPEGMRLIGATAFDSEEEDIWIWHLDGGGSDRGFAVAEEGLFSAMALSPDGAALVSSRDAAISVRKVADGEVTSTFTAGDTVMSLAVSADGRLLAVGLYGGGVELWDLAAGTRLAALAAHTSYATAVAFTPDGADLITASADGSIIAWGLR